jgi:NNP family nitrate/nitrite transporter-like MFS transporter
MSSSSSSIDGIEISPAREQPSAFASAGKNETFSNGAQPHHSVASMPHEAPPFRWASLWEDPVVNPINLKSYTLRESAPVFSPAGSRRELTQCASSWSAIFNLRNPYTINFHLAWLGFFCAFLSWFAFPALGTSIKADLKLTQPQFGNSNVIALCATLVLRLISGPIVDRFGPRKTMAAILVLGAIPSGLAGTVTSYEGLLVLRFFIGILGASFVPCLVWTTCFFDKVRRNRHGAHATLD